MSRKLAARRVTPAMEAGFPVMLGLWRKVRYAHLSQAHLKEIEKFFQKCLGSAACELRLQTRLERQGGPPDQDRSDTQYWPAFV